jgi:hypothetical protein
VKVGSGSGGATAGVSAGGSSGPGTGGGSGTSFQSASASGGSGASTSSGAGDDPIPIHVGGEGSEVVLLVPRSPAGAFAAYITFAFFGGLGPGISPMMLFPALASNLVAAPGTDGSASGASAASDTCSSPPSPHDSPQCTQSSGGVLGAGVGSLVPNGERSSGSALWWLYAGLVGLVAALALTAFFVRRPLNRRIP